MNSPRVVVVTGASAGIGRAVARMCGARGDAVGLLARGETGLDGAARDVHAAGGRALPIVTDMADAAAVDRAAAQVTDAFGPIDVWINVAFTSVFAPFHRITAAEFGRVTAVTYLGFVHGTMAALRRMRPRDRGTIVQVGSALGLRSIPLQSAYCGAKHGIEGFTESLRTELLHDRSAVAVTMVTMPAVNTPQFAWVLSRLPERPQPVPPIYQPEVTARAVLHAAEHPQRKRFLVGASTVGTVWGQRLFSAVLDRYLAHTGYRSQQTGEPADRDAPVNLWEPADGPGGRDYGAHGSFDDRAHARSPQQWAARHLGALTAGAGAVGAGLVWAASRRRTGASRHRWSDR